jgi:hypothetical protein
MNGFVLNLSDSKHIISFARNNLTQFCRSNTEVDIARILKVSTSPAGITYKFDIHSPEESRMKSI